jgi:hypothetical protein
MEGGGVNVFKPKGQENYHVFFRHFGRQVSRSCGTTEYVAAKARAAAIFAEEIGRPKKEAEQATIKEILVHLKSLPHPALPLAVLPEISLDEAVHRYLVFKAGLSKDHVVRMERRLRRFNEWAASKQIGFDKITLKEIRNWLDSLKCRTGDAELKELGEISTFFNWCAASENGWIATNPCAGLLRKPKPRANDESVEVCQVSDVIALFEYLEREYPQYVLYFALAFFGGARKSEIGRAFAEVTAAGSDGWRVTDTYRPEEGDFYIRFPKIGGPRWIDPPLNLSPWMDAYKDLPFRVPWHGHLTAIHEEFKIPHNAARHTCVSAFLVNGGKVPDSLIRHGHTEPVMLRYYFRALRKPDAARFQQILPRLIRP